jgi:ketosteroid isomerase-like protein
MATAINRSADEAAVHAVLESIARAVRAGNVDAMLAQCAEDVVTFDLVAPIKHEGAETMRQIWVKALAAFEPPLDYDLQQLHIEVDGDLAFARCLNRFGGTRRDGAQVVNWMRSTFALRRLQGRWKVVHEHVSVPFDMTSGKALLELHP